jgi:hypothetical protein
MVIYALLAVIMTHSMINVNQFNSIYLASPMHQVPILRLLNLQLQRPRSSRIEHFSQ